MIGTVFRLGDRTIARILLSIAIALGAAVMGAPPTGADPSPFNTLSCDCPQQTAPGSQARRDRINQGLRAGTSAWSPRPKPNPAHA
jgi:hypothetical protein